MKAILDEMELAIVDASMAKDALDAGLTGQEDAAAIVHDTFVRLYDNAPALIAAARERDELKEALMRAEIKLQAYVGVCKGDKELTGTILPMVRQALTPKEAGS